MADVTQVLSPIEAGDLRAATELFPLVYDELRKLAAGNLRLPAHLVRLLAPLLRTD